MSVDCPNCGSGSTERQATMHEHDAIRVVRTCHDCPTQFTVAYGHPTVQEAQKFTPEGA